MSYTKTLLGQIFGASVYFQYMNYFSYIYFSQHLPYLHLGRLNTNDDNENMLGYELYSSALADMLSEPNLSMPITVGLYARWGSGKSFLLKKLRGLTLNHFYNKFSDSSQ